MNKHSKAPWKLKYNKGDAFRIYSADGYDLLCIADDERYGRPEEDAANARLVEAAPKMLAMLKRLSTISTMNEKWDHELFALIEKIEGQKK